MAKRKRTAKGTGRRTKRLRQLVGKTSGGSYMTAVKRSYMPRSRGPEIKTVDYRFSAALANPYVADQEPFAVLNIDNQNFAVQALNLIQQGAGASQRIGNKVQLKSLRLRLSINSTGVAQTGVNDYRLMLVYDRQPNKAYPALNVLLDSLTQANAMANITLATTALYGNINPNNYERFSVIKDWQGTLPSYSAARLNDGPSSNGSSNPWFVNEFIKLGSCDTVYDGTTNPMTVANITQGSLLLVSIGELSVATAPWDWYGTARLRFYDK